MKTKLPFNFFCCLFTLCITIQCMRAQDRLKATSEFSQKLKRQVNFTENKGQVSDQFGEPRPDVLFAGQTNGMAYHLKKDGLSYQLYQVTQWKEKEEPAKSRRALIPDETVIHRTDVKWVGMNSTFTVERGKAVSGYHNYYLASCPDGANGVPIFESISYKGIYDGIDVNWYSNKEGFLEYDFIVGAGIDYRQIRLKIEGAEQVSINTLGELVIQTPLGEIREQAPLAYQGNKKIEAHWEITDNLIGFNVAAYDVSLPLIIDPVVLTWGTYFGGTGSDFSKSAVIDASSNVYVAGESSSRSNIATTGSHQTIHGGGFYDTYLAKFDGNGILQWATYYGGSNFESGNSCAIDASSNVYLFGTTSSASSMTTAGSHQPSFGGGFDDAFLVKFDNNGVRQWATYFGGTNSDEGQACVIDGSSNVYISGYTQSANGIATTGSYQTTHAGGIHDAYLAKFNSSGVLQWSTYYGGSVSDLGRASAVDAANNIYLTGQSTSTTDIATTGSHQATIAGLSDAFLVKFNGNGVRQWATYYGGTDLDNGTACSVDHASNVYLTGHTESTSGIATTGSHQDAYGGGSNDAYLVKFNSNGIRQWATYYGGTDDDKAEACATDASSNVYIGGQTKSTANIASTGSIQSSHGGNEDGMVVKLDSNGIREWATYYGGSDKDGIFSCLPNDPAGVYILGETRSATNIATSGSHQMTLAGGQDVFMAYLQNCNPTSNTINPATCSSYTSPSGLYTWSTSGTYHDTLTNTQGCDSILTINLTVNNSTTSSLASTVCHSYTSPSGQHTWTTSGIYTDTLINAAGCDSILTIDLTIGQANTGVTVTGLELTSDAPTGTYQWLDCNNDYQPINGATNRSYKAIANGSYAVEVTQSCTDTSDCYAINGVGIAAHGNKEVLKLFPNPAGNVVFIDLEALSQTTHIVVHNEFGQVLIKKQVTGKNRASLDIRSLAAGIYLVTIQSVDREFTRKLVKL